MPDDPVAVSPTTGSAPPRVARGPVPMTPHRRWSLRARLIALVVAVAAVALIAVDIVLPLVVRDTQIAAKEVTLAGVIATVNRDSIMTQKTLADLSQKAQLRGEIGWSTVSADGISVVQVPTAGNAAANPQLTGTAWVGAPATVYDADRARELLGYPSDMHCEFMLSFGYPANPSDLTRANRVGGRRPVEDLVHQERWSELQVDEAG